MSLPEANPVSAHLLLSLSRKVSLLELRVLGQGPTQTGAGVFCVCVESLHRPCVYAALHDLQSAREFYIAGVRQFASLAEDLVTTAQLLLS